MKTSRSFVSGDRVVVTRSKRGGAREARRGREAVVLATTHARDPRLSIAQVDFGDGVPCTVSLSHLAPLSEPSVAAR